MFELIVDEKKVKISPERISSIVISNAVSLSSDAIQMAMEHNIDIIFLDQYGNPYGRIWYPKIGSTVLIRRRQLELLNDPIGVEFIKHQILYKIMNQANFLKTLLSKREGAKEEYSSILTRIREFALSINNAEGSMEDLSGSFMGWEGGASKLYFQTLANLIPSEFKFSGRSSRPAADAFNAFLNYGYGILYSKVERALIIAGLDPYIGLLHSDYYNKKSLVFDFIEPYRTFIDTQIFYIFSRRKFQPEFIEPVHNGFVLSTSGKKFLAPILLEHFDEIVRYRNKNRKRIDSILVDAHAFANYLIGKRADHVEKSIQTKLNNFLNNEVETNGEE
jgi:CRISPR-associated protein Cas1